MPLFHISIFSRVFSHGLFLFLSSVALFCISAGTRTTFHEHSKSICFSFFPQFFLFAFDNIFSNIFGLIFFSFGAFFIFQQNEIYQFLMKLNRTKNIIMKHFYFLFVFCFSSRPHLNFSINQRQFSPSAVPVSLTKEKIIQK